jgi:hypothetical protein
MTYTEDEAMTKWCHAARVGSDTGCNRYSMDIDAAHASAFAKCIGSNCMMWRWAQKPNPNWKQPDHNSMSWPPRDTRSDPPMYIEDTTRGYCGLGGRP